MRTLSEALHNGHHFLDYDAQSGRARVTKTLADGRLQMYVCLADEAGLQMVNLGGMAASVKPF